MTIFEMINNFGSNKNLKFVDPTDIVLGGWDVNNYDLHEAAKRAKVLEPNLLDQLEPSLKSMRAWPSIYDSSFVNLPNGWANNILDQELTLM